MVNIIMNGTINQTLLKFLLGRTNFSNTVAIPVSNIPRLIDASANERNGLFFTLNPLQHNK